MGMDISGVSGFGGMSSQVNNVISQLGETNKIVIDIFNKLEDFKTETDKAMVKEQLDKARETIEKLRSSIKQLGPALQKTVARLEQLIDDLQTRLA
jgi:ABC-type transporter Mla subunit MlaD